MDVTGPDRERYAIIDALQKMGNELARHNLPIPRCIMFDREAMQRVRMAFGALRAQHLTIATSFGNIVVTGG